MKCLVEMAQVPWVGARAVVEVRVIVPDIIGPGMTMPFPGADSEVLGFSDPVFTGRPWQMKREPLSIRRVFCENRFA